MLDSCILMDILTNDSQWAEWSDRVLKQCLASGRVVLNVIIYAELLPGVADDRDLDAVLARSDLGREDIPWEAAKVAAGAFAEYRRRGGTRTAPLPDFFIGAHATVRGYTLITRDAARFRTYFPNLRLIAP